MSDTFFIFVNNCFEMLFVIHYCTIVIGTVTVLFNIVDIIISITACLRHSTSLRSKTSNFPV